MFVKIDSACIFQSNDYYNRGRSVKKELMESIICFTKDGRWALPI